MELPFDVRALLYRVAFHAEAKLLKTNPEDVNLTPIQTLQKWVNFHLKNKNQKEISNFNEDLKNCIALSFLLSEITTTDLDFVSVAKWPIESQRSQKFLDLLKQTDFTGPFCTETDIEKPNEAELVKLVSNLFLWSPAVKNKPTKKQAQKTTTTSTPNVFSSNVQKILSKTKTTSTMSILEKLKMNKQAAQNTSNKTTNMTTSVNTTSNAKTNPKPNPVLNSKSNDTNSVQNQQTVENQALPQKTVLNPFSKYRKNPVLSTSTTSYTSSTTQNKAVENPQTQTTEPKKDINEIIAKIKRQQSQPSISFQSPPKEQPSNIVAKPIPHTQSLSKFTAPQPEQKQQVENEESKSNTGNFRVKKAEDQLKKLEEDLVKKTNDLESTQSMVDEEKQKIEDLKSKLVSIEKKLQSTKNLKENVNEKKDNKETDEKRPIVFLMSENIDVEKAQILINFANYNMEIIKQSETLWNQISSNFSIMNTILNKFSLPFDLMNISQEINSIKQRRANEDIISSIPHLLNAIQKVVSFYGLNLVKKSFLDPIKKEISLGFDRLVFIEYELFQHIVEENHISFDEEFEFITSVRILFVIFMFNFNFNKFLAHHIVLLLKENALLKDGVSREECGIIEQQLFRCFDNILNIKVLWNRIPAFLSSLFSTLGLTDPDKTAHQILFKIQNELLETMKTQPINNKNFHPREIREMIANKTQPNTPQENLLDENVFEKIFNGESEQEQIPIKIKEQIPLRKRESISPLLLYRLFEPSFLSSNSNEIPNININTNTNINTTQDPKIIAEIMSSIQEYLFDFMDDYLSEMGIMRLERIYKDLNRNLSHVRDLKTLFHETNSQLKSKQSKYMMSQFIQESKENKENKENKEKENKEKENQEKTDKKPIHIITSTQELEVVSNQNQKQESQYKQESPYQNKSKKTDSTQMKQVYRNSKEQQIEKQSKRVSPLSPRLSSQKNLSKSPTPIKMQNSNQSSDQKPKMMIQHLDFEFIRDHFEENYPSLFNTPNIKQGLLNWKTSNKKSFKKKFIQLKEKFLLIYKDQPSSPVDFPEEWIYLDSSIRISLDSTKSKKGGSFSIKQSKNVYSISSDSKTDLDNWMVLIRKATKN
ncbi:myb-like protein x [Anaeramoeba ignava]|uniref:Myb-like protein x n=1 Tax=Anaeramoeba ignava TaxID=1746090 RepID=A0A9Q0LBG6_ANAIG|nr:myb-like protein x [Anaeramoeba ignava]